MPQVRPLLSLLEDTALVSAFFIVSPWYRNSLSIRFPASCLSFSLNEHAVKMAKVKRKPEHVAPLLLSLKRLLSSAGKPNFLGGAPAAPHEPSLPAAPISHLLSSPSLGWLRFTNLRTPGNSGLGRPWGQWARSVTRKENEGRGPLV